MTVADGVAGGQLKKSELEALKMVAVTGMEVQLRKKFTCYDIMTRGELQSILEFAKDRGSAITSW